MSKKKNKREIETEDKILKTSDYTNFMNELNEMESSIHEDLKAEVKKEEKVEVKEEPKYTFEKVEETEEEEEIVPKKTFTTRSVRMNREVREEETKEGKRIYLSFNTRLYATIAVLFVAILALSYFAIMSFSITKQEIIKYKNKSDIDYKVYLKKNDFYENPYLEKDMVYVASLIDNINIAYKYRFDINKNSKIDFNYKIVAKLVIASQANSNVFFEKEYDLTELKTEKMDSQNMYIISEEATVNYGYYNALANKFRSKYAVNTNSYLDVYLLVNEHSSEDNDFVLTNESKAILTIPLSQQEINITLKNQDIDENKQLLSDSKFIVKNYGYIFISCLLVLVIVILIIEVVRKLLIVTRKSSTYDNYINRILRGYDRIIVNIKTKPNFDDYNTIKVESFQELVDVRDNFKAPINYYIITEHQKCEFFVTHDKDIYIYIVKAIDLDGENNEGSKKI